MRDGAVGLSTGLIYKPGSFSTTEEVVEMQRVAARHGGMYVTHMRSESLGIINAIEEALRIGRESGSRVQISHMKLPTDMAELLGGAEPILDMVRDARRAGHEVWVDQYPYTASSTGISVMLPDWIFADGPAKAREILQDPEQLPRVLESMRSDHEGDRGRESLEYAVVAWSAGFPQYAGMSIKRVAQVMKLQAEKGPDFDWMSVPVSQLPDVTMEDQYRAVIAIHLGGGAGGVYHTMAETEVETIMQADFVAICSDSGVRRFGSGHPHPRGYGSNARVLGQYVRERRILRLEDAIRKMTSLPATAFRMQDRGMIREGFWADIVVFDEATVGDKATFEEPHQYAQGFDHVLVNGEPVIAGAAMTGRLPGSVIRGPGWHAKN
jgi:N-acyl-D-amino-acid deacylase